MEIKTGYTSLNLSTSSSKATNDTKTMDGVFESLFSKVEEGSEGKSDVSFKSSKDELKEEVEEKTFIDYENQIMVLMNQPIEQSSLKLEVEETPDLLTEVKGENKTLNELSVDGLMKELNFDFSETEEFQSNEVDDISKTITSSNQFLGKELSVDSGINFEATSLKNEGDLEGETLKNIINTDEGVIQKELSFESRNQFMSSHEEDLALLMNVNESKNESVLVNNEGRVNEFETESILVDVAPVNELKMESVLADEDYIDESKVASTLVDENRFNDSANLIRIDEEIVLSNGIQVSELNSSIIPMMESFEVGQPVTESIWTNQKEIFKELVEQTTLLKEGEATRLTLKLYPKTLGNMQVELSLENGILQGKIVVESGEVKSMMERAFQQQSFLSGQEVQVSVEVDLNFDQHSSFLKENFEQEAKSSLVKTVYKKTNDYRSPIEEEMVDVSRYSLNRVRLVI